MTAFNESPELFYGKPLTFDDGRHQYRWNGELVPGVTSILSRLAKPALIQWAADMAVGHIKAVAPVIADLNARSVTDDTLAAARLAHRTIKDTAADIGKSVHSYAEAVLSGQSPPELASDMERAGASALDAWLSEHEVEPLALERRVFSQQHYFAGTTDFYGKIDGQLAVLDFKTSSGIWPEYWLQTAAYELALKEELGTTDPVTRWIIRLDKKTGQFEAASRPFDIDHTAAWVQLCQLSKVLGRIERAAKESAPKRPRKRAA